MSRSYILIVALLVGYSAGAQIFVISNGGNISSCSGTFHDTGGPTGNYANNEDLTTTICPAGGSGSGPNTSVTFTAWAVQSGANDRLFIYNGTSVAAPLLIIGDGNVSLLNQTFTATGPTGCLTFRWVSNASVVAAGWTARITTGPSAGTNATHSVCSNAPPFNMTALMGGTPDAGGTWTAPGGAAHSATFDPLADPGGVYTYTVSGPAPCPDSSATLTITKQGAPNAGANGTLTVCSNGPSVALFGSLLGTPQAGGTWTAPGGGAHSGTFIPGTSVPGVYTYTVAGVPPCANASATVTVTVNNAPVAGTNGSITVCSNAAAFSLFAQLSGSPQAGGAWTGPGGGAVPAMYTPGTSTPGVYTYTVNGIPPCANATATVTVTQVAAPNAGSNNSITVCSNGPSFAMITQLGGSPAPGGTWTGPGGLAHGPTFNPSTGASGNYTYTVQGTAPCLSQSAVLTITVRTAPNAGTNGSLTVCSTDADFPLLSVLGGTPDANGTWTAPNAQPHPGTFIPGTSQAGMYTYTVVGQSPCAAATATVTITVNAAPNAGTNATTTVCSNAAPFSLFGLLGGSPNSGGSWTAPGGGSHSVTFNPAVDVPGAYTYTVQGVAPCANATAIVTVSVVTAPNAGTNGTVTVCSIDGSFPLIGILGGTPNTSGTWIGPNAQPHPGTFIPGTSQGGVYTYTVPGTAPCANAVSTVTVTVVTAPNAGSNAQLTICSTDPPTALFPLLGGTPNTGGTWTRPNGTAFPGTYDPANPNHPPGIYTYTVTGTSPCANATATVQVVENPAPNAGTNGTITVCSTNGPFDLLTVLGGNPNPTGTWINAGNTVVSSTFVPGTTPPGTYRYVVNGIAPCVNDTAWATVNVNIAPVAGTNASITVCSSDPVFQLVSVLGGNPDAGGSWVGPGGATNGTYTPGTSTPGVYTYTVNGITPCANAQAVVVVTQNRRPVAGTSSTVTVCSTAPAFSLLGSLGGSPDANGTWTAPGGGASNGQFIPGTSTAGVYTYTVLGSAPCPNVSATVTVVVNQAPDAGMDGAITSCADQSSVDLFAALLGDPDAGGTWSDDDNTGQLSGQFFSPLGMSPGDYEFTYTVPGIGQCASVSTVITVTVVSALDAGTSGTMTVCASSTQVDLFNGLGGTPQTGGVWVDLNSTNALNGQFLNATLNPPGVYQFRYRLAGTVSCASDSALVTLTTIAPANAGLDGPAVFCSNGSSASLFPFLGGNPQGGGVWRRSNNSPFSGVYNPVLDSPGVFKYIVSGTTPCPQDTAYITVTEVPAPYAGIDNSISLCANNSAITLISNLTGNPQTTGTWTNPLGQVHGNTFVPGLDPPGVYIYQVNGQSPCVPDIATLTISVNAAPNAGNNSAITKCSSDPPFLLFGALTGSPQTGGTWIGPGGTSNGVFTPGTSLPGDYIYRVPGTLPCTTDSAIVSVFVNPKANAGTPGSAVVCSNGAAFNLLTVLGGTPTPTGSWIGPNSLPFSGIFVPGTSVPGTYTYTVVGIAPCPNATATATISVNAPPNAGTSAALVLCGNAAPFALVDMLGGNPALNGTWTGPTNLPSNGIFVPSTSLPGCYTYTVPGVAPCANATSTVCITVNPVPEAGGAGAVTLCNTSGATPLFQFLTGNPQTGGSWLNPALQGHSGTFLPAVDLPGVYRYVVFGLAPCANDTATVTVTLNQSPNAGSNGLITVCDDQFPFPLITALNGTPGLNGSWIGPNLQPHSGVFIPGVDPGGVYRYTISGVPPCANATATVTVIQNSAPDAGSDGVVTVCSDQASFALIDELGGSPDAGGSWIGPNNVPFSGTFIPGTSLGGVYTYTVLGVSPCVNASAQVTVVQNTAPDAGISTAPLVCGNAAPFPLIDLLAGSPDQSGSWTGPGGAHGPVFDPTVDPSGTYTYTVTGIAPCTDAVAQAQVTLIIAPNAGTSGSLTACISDPDVDLFLGLGGTPAQNGTWVDNGGTGALSGSILNATLLTPGSYTFTYTVAGTAPCPNASATVQVTVTNALDAGDDGIMEVCDSQTSINLFSGLLGTPQAGGTWTDLLGSGAMSGGVFDPAQAGQGTYVFQYVLPPSASCQSDTAYVTVLVLDGPNAGCPGFVSLCSNSAPFQLIAAMGCGPDAGGSWFTSGGAAHSGTFLPSQNAPGTYLYVVPGVGSCAADSSTVTVNLTQASNAGSSGSATICSSAAPFQLITLLGGTPGTNGSWTGPGGGQHSGTYNPVVDISGTYIYTVPGQVPCGNAVSTVTITENQAPAAGGDNSIAVCSSDAAFPMFPLLSGLPQQGGSWSGPGGQAHSPNFDPAVDTSGAYAYVINGTAPCANDTAFLYVAHTVAANAGTNGILQVCLAEDSVDLFTGLGGSPDTTGAWTDLSNSGALIGSIFYAGQVSPGTYTFMYVVFGGGPCVNDTSIVNAFVGTGLSAGIGGTDTVCGGDPAWPLINSLGGSPSPGGTWVDVLGTGAMSNGVLNATLLPPGSTTPFTYTVNDPNCGLVSTTVVVTISDYPNPGSGRTALICSTAQPIALIGFLGTADPGGIWTDGLGQPHGPLFDPAVDPPGSYTYSLQGFGACPDTSSTVTMIVSDPPDAGLDGSLLACDTLIRLELFPAIGGTPDSTGSWRDLDFSGRLYAGEGAIYAVNMAARDFRYLYIVQVPGCTPDTAMVTVTIVNSVEVDEEDVILDCNTTDRTYTVSFLITGGDSTTYSVTGVPGVLSPNSPFIFTSDPLFTSQSFEIVVNDQYSCGPVTISGSTPCEFEDEVFIPGTFTPNGDGINDDFVIPGIEGYPTNELIIFNRWGDEVYSATGYDNRTKVWSGGSENAVIPGDLPTGTYYYLLDLGNGSEVLKGYVYLNR